MATGITSTSALTDLVPNPSTERVSEPPFELIPGVEEKPLLIFPCRKNQKDATPQSWYFTESIKAEYEELYGDTIDILQQAKYALSWIKSSPSNIKTLGGMRTFLNRWFMKEVNKGKGYLGGNGRASLQSSDREADEVIAKELQKTRERRLAAENQV